MKRRVFLFVMFIAFASLARAATLEVPPDRRVIIPSHWRPPGNYMDVALRCAA
jgi:hypothetical protein